MAEEYSTVKIDFVSDTFVIKFYAPCASTLFLIPRKLEERYYTSFEEALDVQKRSDASEKNITLRAYNNRHYAGKTSGF